jgi:hypothetical protein
MQEGKMQTFDFKEQVAIDLTSLQIEGNRITLKSIEESYSSEIFKEFTSEITRYMFPKPAEKVEETLPFILLTKQTSLVEKYQRCWEAPYSYHHHR